MAGLYFMTTHQFNSARPPAACGALVCRLPWVAPYFSTLVGKTILSSRGNQEVGVVATHGTYGICDMPVPLLPDSVYHHEISQANLEVTPLSPPSS